MFCDEPTSGLDSYMAQNIIEVWIVVCLIVDFKCNSFVMLFLGS